MKKLLLFLLATAGAFSVMAQNITPESDFVGHHNDYVKPPRHKEKKHKERRHREPQPYYQAPVVRHERVRQPHVKRIKQPMRTDNSSGWCIDLNAVGGILTQNVNSSSLTTGYPNSINTKISNPQFNNGGAYGGDIEGAYFFGRKRHFGIGVGLMYIYDYSNVTLDNFHTEYQSYDNFGNTFRQEITADHQVKETWGTSNFNIPLLLKYKTMFSRNIGFTADAGVLFNISERTTYKTNAAFDYEAVYQYAVGEGGITTVYDNATTPAANDLLITKSQYLSTHSSANIQDYFNSLRAQGYNVGLGVTPNNNKGHVSDATASVGLLLRPAISIYLCENFSLNLGVWYLYQDFGYNQSAGYRMTDKTGAYSSVLNSVSNSANNTYGISAGLRYSFARICPEEVPMAPETNDDAIEEKAPVNNENAQIAAPEPPAPASEEYVASENENHVDISSPLLFDVDRTVIKRSSYPILREAINELKEKPGAYLVIHGYTDNTGTVAYNKVLSRKRAQAVKNYLRHHGVKTRTIKTVGHGESSPAASNHTRAGRAKNRRAVIKLKEQRQGE